MLSMANYEHLALLKQGMATWNAWREENPDIQPDLRGAELSNFPDLSGADLSGANLVHADLVGAELRGRTCEGRTCSMQTCARRTFSMQTCARRT
jgi:Pentapeptide repeats (8 copies)